jgi:hypothetical protein
VLHSQLYVSLQGSQGSRVGCRCCWQQQARTDTRASGASVQTRIVLMPQQAALEVLVLAMML